MRFAASHHKPARIYAHSNRAWQQSCSHSNAICNHRFKKRIELRTQTQPLVAEHRGATNRIPTASSPKQSPGNIHAAITIHFAASRSKPACLHTHGNTRWQQSCSHSTAICKHRFKKRIELRTKTQPLIAQHRGGTNRVRNDRSRTRCTREVPFIAACSHFTRKNTRFRAPASSPKQSPCNIHAATTMRFAASRSKPACLHTHGNTRWQQSCSHSNAICNHRFKKRIELRTQIQPLVAKHREGTSSPLPLVTTSLGHHFPSRLPLVSHRTWSMSILFWCIDM